MGSRYLKAGLLLLALLVFYGCNEAWEAHNPTAATEETETVIPAEAPAVKSDTVEITSWWEYGFDTKNPGPPLEVAACVCYVTGPTSLDQELAGVVFRSIPTGESETDLGDLKKLLPEESCKVQVDVTTGRCACPAPVGPVVGWHWYDGRACPSPTPSPTPEPTPTPPGPQCIERRQGTVSLTSTGNPLVVEAWARGTGYRELCIHASSELSECEADEPDYWKVCVPQNLTCNEQATWSASYNWYGHSSEWWRGVLKLDGKIIKETECTRKPS